LENDHEKWARSPDHTERKKFGAFTIGGVAGARDAEKSTGGGSSQFGELLHFGVKNRRVPGILDEKVWIRKGDVFIVGGYTRGKKTAPRKVFPAPRVLGKNS